MPNTHNLVTIQFSVSKVRLDNKTVFCIIFQARVVRKVIFNKTFYLSSVDKNCIVYKIKNILVLDS